ncbi:hypothetical protein DBR06_SOUSAS2410008, partial [Sousa chinensis]
LTTEEKLSKVDETISHNCEQLHTYRKQAKILIEKVERSICSF